MKAFALLLLLAACSDHGPPEVKHDPERSRRVIEPPPPGVRALPPHAIRSDGVGPYRLGATLAELVDQLPSGPRIAQFNIPGIVHRDLLRAEDDAILIGGEPLGKASFVAVVGGEVARTESGIHVGSTRDELVRALGEPIDDPERASDPHVVRPSHMKNLRAVIEGDRIVALVVTADAGSAPAETGSGECQRPAPDPDKPNSFGACLGAGGELVSYDAGEITVTAHDKTARAPVPGIVFAAPLRVDGGRDELVAIYRVDDGQSRSWYIVGYRLEGQLLRVSLERTPLFQLTSANARWIGAELRDVTLYLELTSHPDVIEVGGLLTTSASGKIRDIVEISPVPVARRHPKPPPSEPADAGASDAH